MASEYLWKNGTLENSVIFHNHDNQPPDNSFMLPQTQTQTQTQTPKKKKKKFISRRPTLETDRFFINALIFGTANLAGLHKSVQIQSSN